jgi:hypothetical protein
VTQYALHAASTLHWRRVQWDPAQSKFGGHSAFVVQLRASQR